MLYTTLTIAGVEKPLADWSISTCQREVSNQAHDHIVFDYLNIPADAPEPIPYGTQAILKIGRIPASGPATTTSGLPISGCATWTGGTTWFIGWRVENFRTGSPDLEKFTYKFAGPWEFFLERLIFQKLWFTWNGIQQIADWRSQVILGQSVNATINPGSGWPGVAATNLMSIRQQLAEIIAYAANLTATDYGAPQFQSDPLTSALDGINYDLYETPSGNIQVPDYIPGYATNGKNSATANLTTVLRAPLDSVNDTTCAECLRKMLKWIGAMGDAVVWFDYTTTLAGAPCPTLKISTRDLLPAISLPFPGLPAIAPASAGATAGSTPSIFSSTKLKRRDDLIPPAVEIKFRINGTFDGQSYTQLFRDIAATINGNTIEGIGQTGALYTAETFGTDSPAYVGGSANSATMQSLQNAARDFGAACNTMDMEGGNWALQLCSFSTVPVNTESPGLGGTALAFWTTLFPELAQMSSLQFPTFNTTSIVDDNGSAIDPSVFKYLLTRGQVAKWMLAGDILGGAAIQSINAHVSVTLAGTENITYLSVSLPASVTPGAVKNATCTLVTLPGGTYQKQVMTSAGEIIPYGLAGYIYQIAKIPQYEGTITLQENEITDACPPGNNLNLTGGLAEWATMNAMVQQITYDLLTARTTITIGPAAHLGCKDMIERIRINRGPRWYLLNGANINNIPNTNQVELGSDVAKQDPSHGPRAETLRIFPHNLNDWGTHITDAGYKNGIPGITIDTTGTQSYGTATATRGTPVLYLADGQNGSINRWIRISLADLPVNTGINFQPVTLSINGGTCVTAYVLCGVPGA